MLNFRTRTWKYLIMVVISNLLVAACSGGESPASGGTTAAGDSETPATAAAQTTSSGFVCPEPSPRMEVTSTEVNLFVWTEYIPQDMIDCFEMVYGIEVNRDEYSSNEEMYAKISAGGASYDLVQPTDYIVSLMIRQELLEKFDKSKLPNLENLDPNYLNLEFDPNNEYTLPYQAGTDAIVFNSDTVENPPASWADLWKPEYAGRMVFLDDSRAVIGLTLLTLGYDVNSTDPTQLEEAKNKLAELVPGIKIFDSDSPKTALIGGDADLGLTWTGEAFLAQQEVPAIDYVYPTEGAIVWQDTNAIPAGAPHLDAAYAWLNYTMQGDVFWLMLRDFPFTNPNLAALDYAKSNQMATVDLDGNETTLSALYDAYINSPITNTPAEALQNGHRINDVGEALTLYDQIWTEVKGE